MKFWIPAGLLGALLLGAPRPLRADTLYVLDTFCSVGADRAVPCRVEAVDEGEATVYRHTLGRQERTFRVIDEPVLRIELWNAGERRWESARSAAALLSANALCLNGTSFCVVNPNYLNSVRQDLGPAGAGRDLIEASFGRDGRLNAYCYDDGCLDQGAPIQERVRGGRP